ncbi:hypothetical protein PINS_up023385 [Pythium insidiosum]|nr:hypothetical protein PINS_up023385 [Pythium insidiosum]
MVLIAWLGAVLVAGAVQAETFHGEGTTYGGNPLGGTCGFQRAWRGWSSQSMQLTAALNFPQWKTSLNCGRCVSVKHGDNAPVTIQIVDQCPECKHGDLDFAPDAYNAVIKKGPGREKISWSFVECPDMFATGDFEFVLKEGSNPYWTAFQPQNFKYGIDCVDIDVGNGWERLERNEGVVVGFYFVYQRGVHGPFRLRATSVTGEVIISPTYTSLNGPMRTGQQFGGAAYSKPVKQNSADAIQAEPSPAPKIESVVVAPIAAAPVAPTPTISPPILVKQPSHENEKPIPIAIRTEQASGHAPPSTPMLTPAPSSPAQATIAANNRQQPVAQEQPASKPHDHHSHHHATKKHCT